LSPNLCKICNGTCKTRHGCRMKDRGRSPIAGLSIVDGRVPGSG
jgi:hypothetical protein